MAPQRVIDQPNQFRNNEDIGGQNILTPLTVQEEAPARENIPADEQKEDKELTPLRTMMEESDDNLASFRNASTFIHANSSKEKYTDT